MGILLGELWKELDEEDDELSISSELRFQGEDEDGPDAKESKRPRLNSSRNVCNSHTNTCKPSNTRVANTPTNSCQICHPGHGPCNPPPREWQIYSFRHAQENLLNPRTN